MPQYCIDNVTVKIVGPVVVTASGPDEALGLVQAGVFDKGGHATSPQSDYDLESFAPVATEISVAEVASRSSPVLQGPKYAPPSEQLAAARAALASASPEDLDRATAAYQRYGAVTGGRSAITGAELPPFEKCSDLVRAGWLAVTR